MIIQYMFSIEYEIPPLRAIYVSYIQNETETGAFEMFNQCNSILKVQVKIRKVTKKDL